MNLGAVKILHIDDEPEICQMMKMILEDEVKEFYSAKNTQDGYDIYKKYRPDIVLLDISMPYGDGVEFAKKLEKMTIRLKL